MMWEKNAFNHGIQYHFSPPFGEYVWMFFLTTEQAKSKLMPTGISSGLDRQLLDLLQKCTRENNFVKR